MHGPDHGAARRTCFPDHLGRRAVKVVGRDARRRPAVARDVCIEFVTALPLRGDIAVGGSRRGEVLGGMVERIDAAVAGRREGVARLFGQQPGGGGVPPGVEAPEQAVLHNRHGAFASIRDPKSRIVGCL